MRMLYEVQISPTKLEFWKAKKSNDIQDQSLLGRLSFILLLSITGVDTIGTSEIYENYMAFSNEN